MEKMAVFTQTVIITSLMYGYTDFGREKNPLTGNTYIYQQKKFSKSVVPEL
jgi:hypothetical protein